MSDSDLRDFKAALQALEAAPAGPGRKRLGLLRRTLTLAMKCAAANTDDADVWRMLGEIELMRHERYRRRSAGSANGQAQKWQSRVSASFDRASDYLGRAFLAGDESARSYLSYLYASHAGNTAPKPAQADGASGFVDPFAEEDMSFRAMADAFRKSGRDDLRLTALRKAGRRGHVWALVDLAAEFHQGNAGEQKEAVGLLRDALLLCHTNKKTDPKLLARTQYLMGVCEYHGLGGIPANRDSGLLLIVEAMNDCPEADAWLKAHAHEFISPRRYAPPEDSPLRFFAKSYPRNKGEDVQTPEDMTEAEILAPLDALVGLAAFKEDIGRLIHLARLQKLREANGLRPIPLSLHMAFLGDPGTGKTMAARLVGQVFRAAGLLKKGHLVEVDRSMLVGEYIGQTEKLTRAKLNEALGGVLFIDEAYALGNTDSSRDYGRYALDAILKFMEDRRDELMIIMAGYPGPMKQLFAGNPGIRSRFTHQYEFPAIGAAEAAEIFREFAAEYQYSFADGVEAEIERHMAQALRQGGLFNTNGRGVRTLFEQMIARQARRVVHNRLHQKAEIVRLTLEDLPWETGRARLQVVKTDEA